MSSALTKNEQVNDLTSIERVVIAGDLAALTPDERWDYYRGVCQSVGLNPFTQPFLYIKLSGKLTLYATKGASEQLRAIRHISITQPHVELIDGLCMVTVTATDPSGRTDSELGIVPCEGLRGEAKANAILKAITKAKRRVTLSMCGLGMLDETEVETVVGAVAVELPEMKALSAPRDQKQNGTAPHPPQKLAPAPEQPQEDGAAMPDDEPTAAPEPVPAGATSHPMRAEAIERYRQLAAVAKARGHERADRINAVDPTTLDDGVLAASVKALESYFPDAPEQSDVPDALQDVMSGPQPPFSFHGNAIDPATAPSIARHPCQAARPAADWTCQAVMARGVMLDFGGMTFDAGALIDRSINDYQRVMCPVHFKEWVAWAKAQQQGVAA